MVNYKLMILLALGCMGFRPAQAKELCANSTIQAAESTRQIEELLEVTEKASDALLDQAAAQGKESILLEPGIPQYKGYYQDFIASYNDIMELGAKWHLTPLLKSIEYSLYSGIVIAPILTAITCYTAIINGENPLTTIMQIPLLLLYPILPDTLKFLFIFSLPLGATLTAFNMVLKGLGKLASGLMTEKEAGVVLQEVKNLTDAARES
ncbi:MAG TPA: hypothetical protein VHA52_01550 [Candidatus Babeliaceae bacterium]|nr:hypothetical protein [Candidatus Babeliaceae bacterium]